MPRASPSENCSLTAIFFSDDFTPHLVFPPGLCGYRGLADAPVPMARLPCLLRLPFDFLHEGSTIEADTISLLQSHLADALQATDVWQRLRTIAREGT
ncbi:MAG TPA: hypothetical protein VNK03_05575 [Gammaproteobacteria bacterium]|jgi:hypothetical protein|nr:hypothetical protein [Gammaproteobacteria bacterium]